LQFLNIAVEVTYNCHWAFKVQWHNNTSFDLTSKFMPEMNLILKFYA